MSAVRTRLVTTTAVVALALTACGDGVIDTAAPAPSTAPSPSAVPLAPCPITATEVPAPAGVTADLQTKPVVTPSLTPPPTELQYADIVKGSGAEAVNGSRVEVKYVGAFYDTGQEFDSSWKASPTQTIPFGICQSGVIPGFAVGPAGMKVGGRRAITIPARLGYGMRGSPPTIPGGATLVFVVDLVKVL
jgi:FKBP-type peptidyl-prolyl cis-trans isomerase